LVAGIGGTPAEDTPVQEPVLRHASPVLPFAHRERIRPVNWHRLGRRAFLGGAFIAAAVQLGHSAHSTEYGLDFLGGTWHAGKALLAGLSPYPPPETGSALLHASSGFMTPPPLALIGIPFSLLPFWAAVTMFNLLCAGALVAALRTLGVTDRRLYLLALCSFPFVSSLALGQPDGLFALAAACAWRWRDDPWRGGVAAGALIAAKLLAWPLVIWLLVTRRHRQAGVTAGSAMAMLVGSWACIGFKGMAAYPRLLADDTSTYEYRSHSLASGFMHLGLSSHTAVALTLVAAAAIAAAVVRIARGSDAGWFTAALLGGVLASPIVWDHYLVLAFICLAAIRRLRDPVTWVLVAALWACPVENPPTLWQAWLVPVIACALALRAGYLSRCTRLAPTLA
jgi:alpha-1,2-mannosyltransferase